ncbi:arabinose transporter permease [Mammaliicoccus lentus]|jgi:DHA1 family inner membrane transport protein|uniref:MFS transporter n=1 Tax=Mammaliicoccus lentus TaxID=42858 RepID=A0AAX3W217_MAMLE|nr:MULTISPECIES: MFS transporter [Mammaliicoccus]HBV04031.1 MFS transporter [Staphylococcus sp.]MBF0750304.1 MFS transporter [Mammaliicoccus lentus]MBW0768577.1 MFS transporter [Mammaliicoccus lentus]MBW0770353.1 MFS transporter [Mammaliicoccus lentus]MCD2479136.1 MFS transporter [Mammaliicoccus lentus]
MKKYPLAIWILSLGAFAIGMTEFVIMGLLPNIARDLNVSVSDAGQLITGYALSVAIGGPIIVLATYKLPRKNLLILLMAIFIIGNGIGSFAPNYGSLMISRVIAALAHGSFFGIGSLFAANMVAPHKRASAMALMFMGLTLSNIIGVPFGTFIGQLLGWKMTFVVISVLGLFTLIGIIKYVPNQEETQPISIKNELNVLKDLKLWLTLGVTLFGFSSVFAYFTYISQILINVSNIEERWISFVLIIFGVGVTLGNIIGGRLADWNLNKALQIIFVIFPIYIFLMYYIQNYSVLMVVGIFVFGLIGFSMSPSLQFKSTIVSQDAPMLASTLNQSAFNIGNALGAAIGGVVVSQLGTENLALVAPFLTIIGLIFLILEQALSKKRALKTA